MGLDMYLNGQRYFINRAARGSGKPAVKAEICELGYWRKHPNLHGFIVQAFAEGIDECQRIPLEEERLVHIMEAVKGKHLPHTTGCFFGASEGTEEEMNDDLAILQSALNWLRERDEIAWRSLYYQASW